MCRAGLLGRWGELDTSLETMIQLAFFSLDQVKFHLLPV